MSKDCLPLADRTAVLKQIIEIIGPVDASSQRGIMRAVLAFLGIDLSIGVTTLLPPDEDADH